MEPGVSEWLGRPSYDVPPNRMYTDLTYFFLKKKKKEKHSFDLVTIANAFSLTHSLAAPVKVLKEFFPLIDTNYTPIEPTTFVSETREELHARTARFIAGLIARLDAEQPEIDAVLLVTHAATKIALGRALLQDPERDIRTGTCSLDTYTRIPGSDKWNPVRIGETDFLSKGEEMHWGFGKFLFYLFLFQCPQLKWGLLFFFLLTSLTDTV